MAFALALMLGVLVPFSAFASPVTSPAYIAAPAASTLVARVSSEIPNVSQVAPNFYRGAMPSEAALHQLSQSGIKTVVSLAGEKKYLESERSIVQKLGMRFVHIPLKVWRKPSLNEIDAFMQVVERKQHEPVFVHCVHGRDRTGAMVAIYRIKHDGWTSDQAYAEMKRNGFRTIFRPLVAAVHEFEKRNRAAVAVTEMPTEQTVR